MAVSGWLVCAVLLLCLVTYGESVRPNCPLAVAPSNDSTGFLGYSTNPAIEADCNATLFCNGTLSAGQLQRRSFFITDVKDDIGLWYINNWIQRQNVVCPKNHVLSLVPQQINTDRMTADGVPCSPSVDDTLTVTEGDNVYTSCGTEFDPNLVNFERGLQFFGRPVSVDFCTITPNIPTRDSGFVLRATCNNLCDFALPGCTDYAFFNQWDPEFISNFMDAVFPSVDRQPFRPRKRSVELMEKNIDRINKRLIQKRGLRKQFLVLNEGDCVTYINSTIIITDGVTGEQERISSVICFVTSNPFIKTRKFFRNFDRGYPLRKFFGPGELTVFGFVGTLTWTIPDPETFFLPSIAVARVVNRIYDYIYEQWYRPFPLIATPQSNDLIFPLPDSTEVITPRRKSTDVDVVFPKLGLNTLPQCRRAAILNQVPLLNATIPESQVRFCRLFATACDLSLRTACRELLALVPFYEI